MKLNKSELRKKLTKFIKNFREDVLYVINTKDFELAKAMINRAEQYSYANEDL